MQTVNYLVVSGEGESFTIDGVCGTLENAERICAVMNERSGKGKCFAERRVIRVNNYEEIPSDGKKIVRKVSVRFKRKKGGLAGDEGKIISGFENGICYYDSKKRKPFVTEGTAWWDIDIFTDSDDPDEAISQAKEQLDKQLEEWNSEPGADIR